MVKQTVLPRTANWDTWATMTETLTLAAGSNTIKYQFDAGDIGYINTDNITVADSVIQNSGFETAGTGGAAP